MKKYDVAKALNTNNPKEIYRKLKNISTTIGNDGEFFKKLIIKSSSLIEPRFDDDEDEIGYAADYWRVVEDLYPDLFGVDDNRLWGYQSFEGGEYTMDEFFNLCYMYITSYLTSEKEFLEDFAVRLAHRDANLIKALEENRKEISSMANAHLEEVAKTFNEDKKTVKLESVKPEEYDDISIECTVLDTPDKIKAYITYLPKGVIAYDNSEHDAIAGQPGEVVDTSIKGIYEDKEYIVTRSSVTIDEYPENEVEKAQIVVTDSNSALNQKHVFTPEEFNNLYEMNQDTGNFVSISEPREYIKIDENIIMNGKVILKGSYISLNESYELVDVVDSKTFETNFAINREKSL